MIEPREGRVNSKWASRVDLASQIPHDVDPLPGEMAFQLSVHNQHVPQAVDELGIICMVCSGCWMDA